MNFFLLSGVALDSIIHQLYKTGRYIASRCLYKRLNYRLGTICGALSDDALAVILIT